jgi:RsiW-degrading membrane proteinase PrsW (M82 family)
MSMTFVLAGMTACLLSSYISTFMASVIGVDLATASITISPVVEEMMKLAPVLFYILVFEPPLGKAAGSTLMIAVGFATFENVCYLTQNGAASITNLIIRGFGTGTMHVLCGVIIAIGLVNLWDKIWLRVAGTIGLLAVAINYHAIFNILVSQEGVVSYIGMLIPIMSTALWFILRDRIYPDRR